MRNSSVTAAPFERAFTDSRGVITTAIVQFATNELYGIIRFHTETICDAHSIPVQEQNAVKI